MRGWPYLSNEPSKKNINLDILKISLIWSFVGNSNVFFGTPFRSEFKIRSGPSNCFSSDQILRILNFLFAINILEFVSGKKYRNRFFENLNMRPGGCFDVLKYFFGYSMRQLSHWWAIFLWFIPLISDPLRENDYRLYSELKMTHKIFNKW